MSTHRLHTIEALSPVNPQAQEEITVSTVAKSLTSGTYSGYVRALIQCQDANVRYWVVSGVTPTTTSGYILYAGDFLELNGTDELANFKAIRDDSTDAVLAVSYFDQGGFY